MATTKIESSNNTQTDVLPVSFLLKNGLADAWEKIHLTDLSQLIQKGEIPELKILSAELEKLSQDKTLMYPRFELLVRLPGGEIVAEDFYNMRVTVVFPSWPARFQDMDFRSFAEDLFRQMAPAYLRLQFKWLGVARMKKFEEFYLPWLDLLKTQTPYEERSKLASNLALWLQENHPQNYQAG